MDALTREELKLLHTASRWSLAPDDGTRHNIVRDELGISYVAFLQRLNRLLSDQRAMAEDPFLVSRLRRIRDERQKRRGHVQAPPA